MKAGRLALLLIAILSTSLRVQASQRLKPTSLCSITKDPNRFLHLQVELSAVIVVAFEASHIQEARCTFLFAFGDDYQTFGDRFAVKRDAQWSLMRKFLDSPTNCPSDTRAVKAKIRGTVVRIPATGIIPENEMGLEIVIQSVSEVVNELKCTPAELLPRRGEFVRACSDAAFSSFPDLLLFSVHFCTRSVRKDYSA